MIYIILIGVTLSSVIGLIEGFVDGGKTNPEHKKSAIYRVLGCFAYSTLTSIMNDTGVIYSMIVLPVFLINLLSFYWVVIDLGFNLRRGLNWLYFGTTAKTDALSWKIGLKPSTRFILKVVLLIISGVITLHLLGVHTFKISI